MLCTQGERQPYGSIVAYVFGEDLSSAAFATAITTRKFRALLSRRPFPGGPSVDTAARWVIPLADATDENERLVDGKAACLGALLRSGSRVPPGVCVATAAYDRFVDGAGPRAKIHMELGRKPFESMRWEEIWDAAWRLRGAFLATPLPAEVVTAIRTSLAGLGADEPSAVRSGS